MTPGASPAALTAGTIATERLWEFQLRKEHGALLGYVRDMQKQFEDGFTHNEKKLKEGGERLAALVVRVIEFEKEIEKFEQRFRDQDAILAGMISFLKRHFSEGMWLFIFWGRDDANKDCK